MSKNQLWLLLFTAIACGACSRANEAKQRTAHLDARVLHPVAEKYYVDEKKCPTMAALISSKELSSDSKRTDPWGSEWTFQCKEDGEITVRSPGPDGKPGTADDIVEPASSRP